MKLLACVMERPDPNAHYHDPFLMFIDIKQIGVAEKTH